MSVNNARLANNAKALGLLGMQINPAVCSKVCNQPVS